MILVVNLTEFKENTVATSGVIPINILEFRTDNPTGSTFETAIRNENDFSIPLLGITTSRTTDGTGHRFTIVLTGVWILDRDMGMPCIHLVTILK
ncbi:MAG: hypothetical protein WJ310_04965 [Ferrovum myxofaciens]|jgi:hypothetical protein